MYNAMYLYDIALLATGSILTLGDDYYVINWVIISAHLRLQVRVFYWQFMWDKDV